MNSKTANGIAALLIAGFLFAVFIRNNTGLLISALVQEKGFIKWGAAVLLWQVFRTFTGGNMRTLLDTTASVSVLTAIIIGFGRNDDALKKLQSGIHNFLN